MELWEFYRYVLPCIVAIVIVVYNFYGRRYELITVNSDHIIISRLFMTETPFYNDEITKITLKELPKDRAKLVIVSNGKKMNFKYIDFDIYIRLTDFAKDNNLHFYLENIKGIKEKVTTPNK